MKITITQKEVIDILKQATSEAGSTKFLTTHVIGEAYRYRNKLQLSSIQVREFQMRLRNVMYRLVSDKKHDIISKRGYVETGTDTRVFAFPFEKLEEKK